jgi:hypothetical protein
VSEHLGKTCYVERESGPGASIRLQPDEPISVDSTYKTYGGTVLWPKDELHVTLLGGEIGKLLRARMAEDQGLCEAVHDAADEHKLRFRRTGELFLVERVDKPEGKKRFRRSVVERVQVLEAEPFYSSLLDVLPVGLAGAFEPPPHHLTLYTFHCPEESESDKRGIGLYTRTDWVERVCWPLSQDDLKPVS